MAEFATEVWVCPTHGIIDEGELAEGVDWGQDLSLATGDVAWTGRFYCQRDHADGEGHEAVHLDLADALHERMPAPTTRAKDDSGA